MIASMPSLKKILLGNSLTRYLRANRRISITTSCRDTDYIEKVDGAGSVVEEGDKSYYIMHNGLKVYTGGFHDHIMIPIIKKLKGHHEPQEEKAFHEVLKLIKPGGTMLELGSYWAYYSLWFNKEVKDAKNYMLEPLERNLNIGKSNFELNQATGNFSLGLIAGENADIKDSELAAAPLTSIDVFMEEKSLDYLDILHSDIQGSEYEMLVGAEKALKSNQIEWIFISTHGDAVHEQCLNLLKEHGYTINCVHTIAESFSGDGLIVASSKNAQQIGEIEVSRRKVPFSFLAKV